MGNGEPQSIGKCFNKIMFLQFGNFGELKNRTSMQND